MPARTDVFDRFTDKFLIGDDCWEWQAARSPAGYGKFHGLGEQQAHRVMWKFFRGPIPEGLEIHHVCENRGCVNIGHLNVVTHAENMSYRIYERATHCIRGHAFNERNTRITKRGTQYCRACDADRQRRRRRLLSV